MADHVRVESAKGHALVDLPAGFCGDIILHCNAGMVLKYTVNEVRRPTSADGTRDLTEMRRPR